MASLKLFPLLLVLLTTLSPAYSANPLRFSSQGPSPSPAPSPAMPLAPSPSLTPLSPPAIVPQPSGIKGAYWPSWQALTIAPSSIPTSYFTHVFYAFLEIDATSFEILITPNDELWMENFVTTLHAGSPPALAILSIGGYGNIVSLSFSNMVKSSDNRAAFVQSVITTARTYGFDGLDLDWEFPANPQEMSNLVLLYQELRAAIDIESSIMFKPKLLLSSAVYFASNFFIPGEVPRTYPGDAISSYVDFINPMCYDYHGGWDTSTTGAHSALYDDQSNVSTSYGISTWKGNNVTSKKIVMGMPAYGRTWQLTDPNQHGIGAPANATGPGGGIMTYSDIQGYNLDNNATVVFDNATVSTYSYVGNSWIGYDDVTSVQQKVKFAKDQFLGGYFFWALGFDSNWDLARAASMAWDSE